MINRETIFYTTAGVASRIMDGEAVLVHPGRGEVKVLNELGAEIWKRLDGRHSVGEIVDELLGAYAVDRSDLEGDVLRFMENLRERDLVAVQAVE